MFKGLVSAALLLACSATAFATQISGVTASGFDEKNGHKPEFMLDGNAKTRWAVSGKGNWAVFQLADETEIHNIVLHTFKPAERRLKFDLLVSQDNQTWVTLAQGVQTSTASLKGEKFVVKPVKARWVKLQVHGTDINSWSSLHQVAVNSDEALPETALN